MTDVQEQARADLVFALRSNKYKQAKGMLRFKSDNTTRDTFCCLGVASNLVNSKKWKYLKHEWVYDSNLSEGDNGSSTSMTTSVMDMYGFNERSGEFLTHTLPQPTLDYLKRHYPDTVRNHITNLVSLNDGGVPFDKIADVIEAEPHMLFKDSMEKALKD